MNEKIDQSAGFWRVTKHPWTVIGIAFLLMLLASYAINPTTSETKITRLAKDEIVVVRTPGGMLEVSTLIKNEEFGWSTKHTCPFINCGDLLKATISDIRVPVHYTYRIPLSENWTLKPKATHYELVVPMEEPKLPVAIDFTKMEMRTSKGWLSPNERENRESLLRQLGPELARRSTQKHYIEAQREASQNTIVEFSDKWMKEQGLEKRRADMPVKVVFSGDAASAVH